MNEILGREPVLWLALVGAAVSLAVGFGVHWSGEQVALIMAATVAILGVIARSKVTPV